MRVERSETTLSAKRIGRSNEVPRISRAAASDGIGQQRAVRGHERENGKKRTSKPANPKSPATRAASYSAKTDEEKVRLPP